VKFITEWDKWTITFHVVIDVWADGYQGGGSLVVGHQPTTGPSAAGERDSGCGSIWAAAAVADPGKRKSVEGQEPRSPLLDLEPGSRDGINDARNVAAVRGEKRGPLVFADERDRGAVRLAAKPVSGHNDGLAPVKDLRTQPVMPAISHMILPTEIVARAARAKWW
jgi:hypothetical protein